MSYRLSKFGTVTLPTTRISGAYGTGGSVEGVVRAVGRAHDAFYASQMPLDVPYSTVYAAWVYNAVEATAHTELAALQALRGTRAKLYRIDEYNSDEHWCYARCMQVRTPWQVQRKTMQPVEVEFQVQTPWYETATVGDPWVLDDGEVLDAGLFLDEISTLVIVLDDAFKIFYMNNQGNANTRWISIAITAKGTDITRVSIWIGLPVRCLITWIGTLAVNKTLVIDGRNHTITNDGVDAYSGFSSEALHVSDHWFEFEPGLNYMIISRSGGNATSEAAFTYAHAWE